MNRVAFIAHPTDLDMFKMYMQFLRPDKQYRDELLIKLFEWAPPYTVKRWDTFDLGNYGAFGASFVMVPFLPEMKDIAIKSVVSKINGALEVAHKDSCNVAALGAFTSIVMQGQEKALSEKYNIKITSGNTLTTAIVVSSIEELVSLYDIDLQEETLAIIGASGDIGSGCMAYFADKVDKIILSARNRNALQDAVNRFSANIQCKIEMTTDIHSALKEASIVIFATSAYSHLCGPEDFNPGTIVCDASAPQNVRYDGETSLRQDVFIYHGGIVKLPFEIDIGHTIGLAGKNLFYGCQTEGILLALNDTLPVSWGRGNITREKIYLFLDELKKYPFIRNGFSIGIKEYSDEEIAEYGKRIGKKASLRAVKSQ
jgi:fatty aldehyde-generating acyl-ACP reductase